ncbi:MAG: CHASE sensor domain-containing protein, partial [Pseudomonadota bacterium]|nr:CHASE sensor domain-containing protein [Pseudomonadota bacterium]
MNAVKRWFERLPIGGKLTMLASLVSGLALLISGLLLTITDYSADQHEMQQRLQTQAQITARDSEAAVAFDDRDAATRSLSALSADQAIVAAETRHSDGQVLARYDRDAAATTDLSQLIHVQAEVILD